MSADAVTKLLLAHFTHGGTYAGYLSFAVVPGDSAGKGATSMPVTIYARIRGLQDVDFDGKTAKDALTNLEMIIRFEFTDKYPHAPPGFRILTPNGVYGTDGKICVSIGEFHSQNYQHTLGFAGFAMQLVSGILTGGRDMGGGIRVTGSTSMEVMKMLSMTSRDYNARNFPVINTYLDIYQLALVAGGTHTPGDKEHVGMLMLRGTEPTTAHTALATAIAAAYADEFKDLDEIMAVLGKNKVYVPEVRALVSIWVKNRALRDGGHPTAAAEPTDVVGTLARVLCACDAEHLVSTISRRYYMWASASTTTVRRDGTEVPTPPEAAVRTILMEMTIDEAALAAYLKQLGY